MKRLVIISFLLLCVFGDLKAAHIDKQEKHKILKRKSSSKLISDFYREINNILDIRLIYSFKISSKKTYDDITGVIISLNNTKKDRDKKSGLSPINVVGKNIIQQLRELRELGDDVCFLDKNSVRLDPESSLLADFQSADNEYRALFDLRIKINYEAIPKDFLEIMPKCLSDLKLQRHVVAFINFNHEFKQVRNKFINFNKKYFFLMNLLAADNHEPILNADSYIYFLDEISAISEIIMSWDTRKNQIFSHVSQEDWIKISQWELSHKKFMPALFIDFKTGADFCCYDD